MDIRTVNNIRCYSGDIAPESGVVFVFGSNPEGRHGAGAAKVARERFGAVYGRGEGLQGNAYALPTKDLRVTENRGFRSISPETITESIKKLYGTARRHPDKSFCIAYRNTDRASLNGYTGIEMMRMFAAAGPMPDNVIVSEEWAKTGKEILKMEQEPIQSAELLAQMQAVKEKTLANGSYMRTPTGEPTTLTEREWLISRTRSFRDAYGIWEKDALTAEILKNGINSVTLQLLKTVVSYGQDAEQINERVLTDHGILERISQEILREGDVICRRNDEASLILRGSEGTDSQVSPVEDYDRQVEYSHKQTALLEEWARANGIWHDNTDRTLSARYSFLAKEGEATVYYDEAENLVYKAISLDYYISPSLTLDRINIQNRLFPNDFLDIVGVGRDADGRFQFVCRQPFIRGEAPTPEEVRAFITGLGFRQVPGTDNEYTDDDIYIGDLHTGNVLKDASGILHVFDNELRLNTPGLGYGGKYILPDEKPAHELSPSGEPHSRDIIEFVHRYNAQHSTKERLVMDKSEFLTEGNDSILKQYDAYRVVAPGVNLAVDTRMDNVRDWYELVNDNGERLVRAANYVTGDLRSYDSAHFENATIGPDGSITLDAVAHSVSPEGDVETSERAYRVTFTRKELMEMTSKDISDTKDLILNVDGTPKILWHGSPAEFDTFDFSHAGENTGITEYTNRATGEKVTSDSDKAFFFTDNRQLAISYGFLARTQQLSRYSDLLTDIGSLLNNPEGSILSRIHSKAELIDAVGELRKEGDAQMNAILDKLPDLTGEKPLSSMAEADRKALAKDVFEVRNRYSELHRKNSHGGISNQLNNFVRQKDYLAYFAENLDRLCANDPTVRTEFDKDFNTYNNTFFGPDHGSGVSVFLESETRRMKAAGFHKEPVYLDTLTPSGKKDLLQKIENDLNACIESYNKDIETAGFKQSTHLYPVHIKARNPLVHDYQGSSFPDKYIPNEKYGTAYIAAKQVKKALADGNDAVIYKNIRDPFLGTTYGVFSTENIVMLDRSLLPKEQLDCTLKKITGTVEKYMEIKDKNMEKNMETPATVFEEYKGYGYSARTYENARQADITLAFATDFTTAGEKYTEKAAGNTRIPIILNGPLIGGRTIEFFVRQLITDINLKCRVLGIDKGNLRLNIAGNGIYTLAKSGYTQADTDKLITDVLAGIQDRDGIHISSIRSGGQTGVDEAGVKAGRALGLPTTVLAPKGWAFRIVDGNGNHRDIYDERAFKARFGVTMKEAVRQAPVRNTSAGPRWTPVRSRDGKWNYRDAAGHLLAGAWLDKAEPFRNGRAIIERGGTRAEINEEGVVTAILAQKMGGPKL